ncbi:hypothetical protein GAY33_10705 [Azospirillum brasilense]|uniref:hypothetical protein n=1 Tax=Azospirillum argentinense TaxID=2970906 RepID=UPI00190D43B3|nr:hypothetical protein [Azospirillum argentinense]MBK3799695.1 hypothetical protein [Azospirillum argentinense]
MNEDETIKRLADAAPALGLGTLVGMALGHDAGLDAVFLRGRQHHAFEVKGSHPSRLRCQQNFDSGFARLPQITFGRKHWRLNRELWVTTGNHEHSHYEQRKGSVVRADIENAVFFLLAGLVAAAGLTSALAHLLGISFATARMSIAMSVLTATVVLGGGGMLSDSRVPGPARCAALATALWAVWFPVIATVAQEAAGIDPTVGPMPYHTMPLLAEPWFQATVLAVLAVPATGLTYRASRNIF